MTQSPITVDVNKAKKTLRKWWKITKSRPKLLSLPKDKEIKKAIRESINSNIKSYRYVLPTQLLAKVTDPAVDSLCMQKKRGGAGAFDARSFCKKIIVPFDSENDNVLNGSPDPYVSKPLRHKEITSKYRNEIKDKSGWDRLSIILNKVEKKDDPSYTFKLWCQTLYEIKNRLEKIKVTYPIPDRVSMRQTINLLEEYLSEPSKAVRPEVIVYSIFETIRKVFGCYSNVSYSKTTAADSAKGKVSDVECYKENIIISAIEVKDGELVEDDIRATSRKAERKGVTEVFFVTRVGVKKDEDEKIKELIKSKFGSGQNIYIITTSDLAISYLPLLGEEGRKKFLEIAGKTLEESNSPYDDRKQFSTLLKKVS